MNSKNIFQKWKFQTIDKISSYINRSNHTSYRSIEVTSDMYLEVKKSMY